MISGSRISFALAAMVLAAAAAAAEPPHEGGGAPRGGGGGRPAMRQAEPHAGPSAYQRVTEPQGWNNRPATVDRGAYQHNYQAARSYRIGPYRRPAGWVSRQWSYGQYLPRAFWASQYIIGDYWLFALEVPPAGYEWVRYGPDAILVNVATGQILQVEYGVFA